MDSPDVFFSTGRILMGGGGSIFNRDNIVVSKMSFIITGLVLFTLIFEYGLHRLEHFLTKHRVYKEMVDHIIRELMLLGLISFLLLMFTQLVTMSAANFVMFEFAHVWIFFVAIFYVLHGFVFMVVARKSKRKWELMDRMPAEVALNTYIQKGAKRRSACAYFCCGSRADADDVEFQVIRSVFLKAHALPRDFSFAKYLRRSMSAQIVKQLDIHPYSWLVLLLILGMNAIRIVIAGDIEEDGSSSATEAGLSRDWELVVFCIGSWATALLAWLLLLLVRWSHRTVVSRAKVATSEGLVKEIRDVIVEHQKLRGQTLDEASDDDEASTSTTSGFRRSTTQSIRRRYKCDTVFNPVNLDILEEHLLEYGSGKQLPKNRFSYLVGNLFPCNSTVLMARAHEVLTLFQCFQLSLIALLSSKESMEEWGVAAGLGFLAFSLTPHLLVLLWMSPLIIREFTFVTAVGWLDLEVVRGVLTWQKEVLVLKGMLGEKLRTQLQGRLKVLTQLPRGALTEHIKEWAATSDPLKRKRALNALITRADTFVQEHSRISRSGAGYDEERPSDPYSMLQRTDTTLIRDDCALVEMFQVFDNNGDGVLSFKEFGKAMKMLGIKLKTQQFVRLCRSIDSDLNGTIDYSEFVELMEWSLMYGSGEGKERKQRRLGTGLRYNMRRPSRKVSSSAVEMTSRSPPMDPLDMLELAEGDMGYDEKFPAHMQNAWDQNFGATAPASRPHQVQHAQSAANVNHVVLRPPSLALPGGNRSSPLSPSTATASSPQPDSFSAPTLHGIMSANPAATTSMASQASPLHHHQARRSKSSRQMAGGITSLRVNR